MRASEELGTSSSEKVHKAQLELRSRHISRKEVSLAHPNREAIPARGGDRHGGPTARAVGARSRHDEQPEKRRQREKNPGVITCTLSNHAALSIIRDRGSPTSVPAEASGADPSAVAANKVPLSPRTGQASFSRHHASSSSSSSSSSTVPPRLECALRKKRESPLCTALYFALSYLAETFFALSSHFTPRATSRPLARKSARVSACSFFYFFFFFSGLESFGVCCAVPFGRDGSGRNPVRDPTLRAGPVRDVSDRICPLCRARMRATLLTNLTCAPS